MRTLGLLLTLLAGDAAGRDRSEARRSGRDDHHLGAGHRLRHRSPESRPSRGDPQPRRHTAETAAPRRARRAHRGRAAALRRRRARRHGSRRAGARVLRHGPAGSSPDRDDNINARYIVEEADITGVPDDELTQALRDDLQALVGKRLDSGDADRSAGAPRDASCRATTSRAASGAGARVGRIRLVYEASKKELPSLAALRAAASRTRSFTPNRAGAATWTSASAIATSASRQSSPSTTRTISSRSTPATGCASKRGSWARVGSAPASSGPGSIRTGARATLAALALKPEIPAPVRHALDDHALAEVCPQSGPQRRRGREHLGAGAALSRDRLTDGERGGRLDRATTGDGRQGSDASTTSRPASACAPAPGTSKATSPTRGISARARIDSTSDGTTCRRPAWPEGSPVIRRSSNASRSATRRRSAAGTSTTSRPPAATAWSTRRSSIAIPASRSSSISVRSGTRTPSAQVRVSTGFGFHAGPAFLMVGFPLNTDNLTAVVTVGLRIPGTRDPVVAPARRAARGVARLARVAGRAGRRRRP